MSRTTYRVVQWATGNIGTKSLRAVIEHPNLELVGLYVHSPDKAGKDAGELCGAGTTGVVATTSIDDVLALGADCVLYMQQGCDFDDVCRILESGANIVTTRGEFHRPASIDPAVRERIEAACAQGRHFDSRDRQQPGVHLGSATARAAVDGATPRSAADRRVRRHVVAQLARDAVRSHGLRRRPGEVRRAALRPHR